MANDNDGGVPTINFTIDKYYAFKRAHGRAVKDGKDVFRFDGHTVLTSYAVYMIEYMATKFEVTK